MPSSKPPQIVLSPNQSIQENKEAAPIGAKRTQDRTYGTRLPECKAAILCPTRPEAETRPTMGSVQSIDRRTA